MPDITSEARKAGFSDDEISAWATDLRKSAKDAGFTDPEVDSYLGVPATPKDVPQPLLDRFEEGAAAAKRQGGLIQTVPEFAAMVTTPEGRAKLWDAVKQYPKLFMEGMVEQAKVPGEVAKGNINLNTDEGMDQAIGLGTLIGFGRLNKLPLTAKTAGGALLAGETMAKVERQPGGGIVDTPIGRLPTGEDFSTASKVIGNGDSMPMAEKKLLDLYREKGIHPAEVAHDAQTDPTISQGILSVDEGDTLGSYGAPPEFVRFYHGGSDPTSGGPRWVAPNEDYARNYHGQVNEVHYVDIPRGDPTEVAARMWDEFDEKAKTNIVGHYGNIELPEEWAKRLRPLEDDTPPPGGGKGGEPPVVPPPPESAPPPIGRPPSYSDAEKTILSKISIGEKAPESKLTFDKLYTSFLDKYYPISKATIEDLPTEEHPYQLTRLLAGYAGKADHFLNRNTFDFNTYENNGKALKQILAPVADDLNSFRAYGTAARALELEGRGIKSGFDVEAAQTVVDEGAGKFGKPFRELVDYQNRVSQYLRDSGVLSKAGYDAMVQGNKMYLPYSRVMGLDETKSSFGGITLQARNPIREIKGSTRDIVDPIESIVRNTYHLVEMAEKNQIGTKLVDMMQRIQEALPEAPKVAEKAKVEDSKFAPAISEALAETGIKNSDDLAESLAHASAPVARNQIAILRDGKRETYTVDPDLAASMKALDRQSTDMLVKMLGFPASTLRAGAVATPEFWGRHIVRDFLYAMTTFKGGVFHPLDMAKGMAGLIMKDDDYWNWLKGGGGNISVVGVDRQYLQANLRELTGHTGLMGRAWNVLADPDASMWQKIGAVGALPFQAISKFVLDPLRTATQFAENTSHLAAFKKGMRAQEMATDNLREQVLRSAWVSRDTAVDAARMGAAMHSYNMIVAFGNIVLQDTDRVARAIKDNPIRTLTTIAGAITAPSVLLWSVNHDDPDYQQLPQWQKDFFWIVPVGSAPPSPLHVRQAEERGEEPKNSAMFFARMPKPWSMGMIFGTLPERMLEEYKAQNPDAFKDYFKNLWEASGPKFTPTAAAPIVEHFANRSTFTNRTLIPQAQEKFLPEYQYTPYTTELTKEIGKVIGAFPGISELKMQNSGMGGVAHALTSPILMENYIRGWSGTLGTYTLKLADTALRKAGILPDPPQPASTLADIPFVKAFVVRYPTATTESIQSFHDAYAQNRAYYDTWEAKAKDGDLQAMKHIKDMGGLEMFEKLDGVNTTLSEHSQMIRYLYKNPNTPPDEKRQLIDQFYYRMIEVAQYGNQIMRQAAAEAERQRQGRPPQ